MNYFISFWLYAADLIIPNLPLLCLLVRMTSDQSSGQGNLNYFLIVMICMHLLGKGEPLKKNSSLSFKVLSSEAKKVEHLFLIVNCLKKWVIGGLWGQSTQMFLLFGWLYHGNH